MNATTHRNFLDRACVQVAVYDDRVEITSPGMLYGGLTIEQMRTGITGSWRNKDFKESYSKKYKGAGGYRYYRSCRIR